MGKVISIQTSDTHHVKELVKSLYIPPSESHKGQNGKLLVVGGSKLFHSPPIWSAEIASHFVDMIHLATTYENMQVMTDMKKSFRNGIVVSQKEIDHYAKEDDTILVGGGMVREGEEAGLTSRITKNLLTSFPSKRIVLDAGALQMMKLEWLEKREEEVILTPHQLEFERLFNIKIIKVPRKEKIHIVEETAKKYGVVILLKAIYDIASDGETTYVIDGGNAGLTKGGTGDLLAGLTSALYTKNESVISAACASCLLKVTADRLYIDKGYWYNMDDILAQLPQTAKSFFS